MSRGGRLLFAVFMFMPLFVGAQLFVDLDWSQWSTDTVVPCYTESRPIGADYSQKSFSATLEYPEFQPLTPEEVLRFRLQNLEDTLPEFPVVHCHVGVSAKQAQLDIDFIPIVFREGIYQRINSFKLVVNERVSAKARMRIDAVASESARYATHSALSSGTWVKIRVSESGVYKITSSELSSMGFSDMSKVRLYGYGGLVLPESGIEDLSDDLREVPLWRESNYLLFYANGTIKWSYDGSGNYTHRQNSYSSYGYYFLTANDSVTPMTFPQEESLSETASTRTVSTYPDYALYEKEEYSWSSYGRQFFDSYDFASGRTQRYSFSLPGAIAGTANISLAFGASGSTASSLSVSVNDSTLGYLSLSALGSYMAGVIATKSFNLLGLKEQTTVTLTHSAATGTLGHLDYIRLNYQRTLALRNAYTNFRSATAASSLKFNIAGADANTHVWRVTEPAAIAEIGGTLSGGTYSLVTANATADEYVAVNVKATTFKSIEVVGKIENQDLHAMEPVDYVIIIPANGHFLSAANTLAEAHITYDSLKVAVVRADQIFNEFSSGTPDATAYRRFLKMLYDRAANADEAPKYLLLFGDGCWDNRMVTTAWEYYSPDDFLLCYESENSTSEVRSYVMEEYYGLLDDGEGSNLLTDKTDLGVGRFPVQTVQQANEMVEKTINYMRNTEAGNWKNTLCMLGDDGDNNQHMSDAEAVAQMLEENHPAYLLKRIYWDTYEMEVSATGNSYPAVEKRLKEILEEGALMVNYTGHGSPDVLSHELVFKTSDMESLTSPRLPLWITASCTIGPFDASGSSLGEAGILNPKGGAIAMFTTARTVYSSQNRRMNLFFSDYVLGSDANGKRYRIGDAVRLAKCSLITSTSMRDLSENKLQFVLLGDPALKLMAPEYRLVVDELDGGDSSEANYVSAGSKVNVRGHVLNDAGNVATDFNGVVYSVVMDSKETITTFNNQDAATTPFTYTDRTKTLFSGSDSVSGGYFSISFPVSLDINYSDEEGLINLYAINGEKSEEAQGNYTDFIVGGTAEELSTDTVGPVISLYLNTPDFIDGDEVNTTPYLVMTLQDDDGINTVGNGIGHDIMVIIDNSPLYTYTLNNYFTSEIGDYTKGTVVYSLPELTAGEHTLLVRAWDVLNNSSVKTLTFTVVEGLRPHLADVTVTANPARSQTTFVLTHDRPQSELTVKLEVFSFMGEPLWSNSETLTNASNTYTYSWNLCASGGQPLLPGVYLYRASLSSNGSSTVTKTRKLIILSNK